MLFKKKISNPHAVSQIWIFAKSLQLSGPIFFICKTEDQASKTTMLLSQKLQS